jgi:hypothetical protein
MDTKRKTRKNKWMVCLVDTLHIHKFYGEPINDKAGYISEFYFCEKYNIPNDQFIRWIMKTPCKLTAGFNNVLYNEEQLIANIPKIKSTQ